jgi:flagellar FliL protein
LPVAPPPPVAAEHSGKKKKRLIIIAALLLLLLAGGGGTVWWVKLRVPPPPPPKPQVIVVPSTPPAGAPAEFLIPLAPFWLELTSDVPRDKDRIFFLVCKFTAIAKSEATLQETQGKIIIIRDALYFYLKNKNYEFLTNPDHAPAVKRDLTAVINGYLTGNNQVDDVLFERYVAK